MARRLIPLLFAATLFASACGSADPEGSVPLSTLATTSSEGIAATAPQDATTTTAAADDGFPVTIDAPNGSVTIESKPERVISISPTSTEVLFAIGAGDQDWRLITSRPGI